MGYLIMMVVVAGVTLWRLKVAIKESTHGLFQFLQGALAGMTSRVDGLEERLVRVENLADYLSLRLKQKELENKISGPRVELSYTGPVKEAAVKEQLALMKSQGFRLVSREVREDCVKIVLIPGKE